VTDSPAADRPDLTGAVIYVEANSPSIAQGRWHILPDDIVYFERDSGEITKSLISASTLRHSPTWTMIST
jgi:hypothetical protein